MIDILSYVAAFAAETAAALSGKADDPVAWFALIGALILGSAIGRRRDWVLPVGFAALAFAVLALESTYQAPVTRGDRAALALIYIIGWVAGSRVGLWLGRRSA